MKVNDEEGCIIRHLYEEETPLLRDFLYEAVFIPEGETAPPENVLDLPELKVYIEDFGKKKDDLCIVAECDGKIVGAVWTRIMKDYGNIDDVTPSLAISLYKEYRNRGIGTLLMTKILGLLGEKGYGRVSLSVQKANYAVLMYLKMGFEIVKETEEEYVMVKELEIKDVFLETARLILRSWHDDDAEILYKYAKDPAVGPVAGWHPHLSVEDSRNVIRDILSAPETYAVVLKENSEPVGSVGVMFGNGIHSAEMIEGDAEIGYWIGVPYWGKGLIPEAVNCLLRHCFEKLKINRVWCGYYDGNSRSRRVMEKCGFRFHHTEENKTSPMGDVRTEHFMLLAKDEFEKNDK